MDYYNFIALCNHEKNTIYPLILTNTQHLNSSLKEENGICMFDLDHSDYISKKMDWKIHHEFVPTDMIVKWFLNEFKFPYNPEMDSNCQGYLTMNDLSQYSSGDKETKKKYKKIIKMINEIVDMYDWRTDFSWDSVIVIYGKIE